MKSTILDKVPLQTNKQKEKKLKKNISVRLIINLLFHSESKSKVGNQILSNVYLTVFYIWRSKIENIVPR